jgi:F0F1-type ATP synthase assembly protein I
VGIEDSNKGPVGMIMILLTGLSIAMMVILVLIMVVVVQAGLQEVVLPG